LTVATTLLHRLLECRHSIGKFVDIKSAVSIGIKVRHHSGRNLLSIEPHPILACTAAILSLTALCRLSAIAIPLALPLSRRILDNHPQNEKKSD
jgi:hypothetical protein